MGRLTFAYMNVERGCVAVHVCLESCGRKGVEEWFVGECWVAAAGSGKQSHLDYMMLGSTTKGTRVVVYVGRDLVDGVELVATTAGAVVVRVGSCRIGGVYGKCGAIVHAIADWLVSLEGWLGDGDWVLVGNWNAHHSTWSLDGRSGPSCWALAEWVQGHGAEVHFGEGGTFERRHGGSVVQSRIDFAVFSPNCGWTSEDGNWLLSDHKSVGGSLVVRELEWVDRREVIDWDRLAATLADEDEGWYANLAGGTAYAKLQYLKQKHLKTIKVCGRSKCWWNGRIVAQVAVVQDYRRRNGRNGDWIRERHQQKYFGAPTHWLRSECPRRSNADPPSRTLPRSPYCPTLGSL